MNSNHSRRREGINGKHIDPSAAKRPAAEGCRVIAQRIEPPISCHRSMKSKRVRHSA